MADKIGSGTDQAAYNVVVDALHSGVYSARRIGEVLIAREGDTVRVTAQFTDVDDNGNPIQPVAQSFLFDGDVNTEPR